MRAPATPRCRACRSRWAALRSARRCLRERRTSCFISKRMRLRVRRRQAAAYAVGEGGRLHHGLPEHDVGERRRRRGAPARARGSSWPRSVITNSTGAAAVAPRRRAPRLGCSQVVEPSRAGRSSSAAAATGVRADAQQRDHAAPGRRRPARRRRAARPGPWSQSTTLSSAHHPPDALPALLDRGLGTERRRPVVLRVQRPRRARTAARRCRTARRGCRCTTCRARASSSPGSARRAGAAAPGRSFRRARRR